ncbi:hypothetical protein P0Y43_15605 [Pseudomonas entomophila]|uniref:hypothetical protein n=1 Tax=Pseudomonas entomophila TaxID=312306 RepID=UPI0023D7F5EA|nr:hypothetical protein [Pseudomonas entomophila]MDF0732142.1 hypothetical protein [Pseudomonas entomophila]
MKALSFALALLATTTVTSAFAEGGADRLLERQAQWALQIQQQQEVVAKRDNLQAPQERAQSNRAAGTDSRNTPAS